MTTPISCPFPKSWEEVQSAVADAAGKPGEGVHKLRVGPFAAVDTILTVLVCLALWRYFAPRCWGNRRLMVFILAVFLLSVPVHMLFGVETAGVKMVRSGWDTVTGWISGNGNGSASYTSSTRFSSTDSYTRSGYTTQADTDSYPLAADMWRASPVDETGQDFSDI